MTLKIKYKRDRLSRRITTVVIALVVLAVAYATYYFLHAGGYYPAWLTTFVLAVAALYILSIPRNIQLTDEALEIHCVVELSTIKRDNIRSAKMVEGDHPHIFPLLGSYGFFGYYGYYLDYRRWEIVKLYASEWCNFVEIEDIYEQRYIISCSRAEELLERING